MSAPVEEIADALVEFLGGLELSKKFKATKPEKPQRNAESADLVVQVIPFDLAREKAGRRGVVQLTPSVNVYVTRQLDHVNTRAKLNGFVEELAAAIDFETMAGWRWLRTDVVALYSRETEQRADRFASLLRPHYRRLVLNPPAEA